jgi:DNA-binding transcriptional regulator YhcF (GntR family)
MDLTIDSNSPIAPFEQVRLGMIARIAAGDLVAGSRLPTVRSLAIQLGLATNTVARAFRELEADGVIETRGRNGSFVRASGDSIRRGLDEAARAYADRARELGVAAHDALTAVAAALRS